MWLGEVRFGRLWRGQARYGKARILRLGLARPGKVRQGEVWQGKAFDTNLIEIEVEKDDISFSTYHKHGVTTFEFIEYHIDDPELGAGRAVLFEIDNFLYESYEVK